MEKSKQLRKQMTLEELRLWYLLRGRRFFGYKFRRQMPIGAYIVDFACFKAKLIIELDGGQHQDEEAYDQLRTAYLKTNGWEVVRFWNNEFRVNEEEVLNIILQRLQCLMPSPSPTGRGNSYSLSPGERVGVRGPARRDLTSASPPAPSDYLPATPRVYTRLCRTAGNHLPGSSTRSELRSADRPDCPARPEAGYRRPSAPL